MRSSGCSCSHHRDSRCLPGCLLHGHACATIVVSVKCADSAAEDAVLTSQLSPKSEAAMGLWDALSGKVWHWNTTRLEVHQVVYPRLQSYPAEKHTIRDLLFASYFAFFDIFGRLVFSENPEIRARNYIGRLKSVNKNGFMNLASSYFCDSALRVFAGSQDEVLRSLGAHLVVQACLLYGRDQLYAAQRLDVFANINVDMSARFLGGEVAIVLGLDPTSERDMHPWFAIRDEMEAFAFACIRQPDWNKEVTRELSRPPRVGGYPDSIVK